MKGFLLMTFDYCVNNGPDKQNKQKKHEFQSITIFAYQKINVFGKENNVKSNVII